MNWDAIGAVGEILGAVAVVASLFYIGRQMKHNTIAIRGQTFEALSSATNETTRAYLGDPQLLDLLNRGLNDENLTPEERGRFAAAVIISLRHAEAAHYQYQLGLLEKSKLKSLTAFVVANMGSTIGEEVWQSSKVRYDEDFISFIEASMRETDPKSYMKVFRSDT